jgi:hypothetical protein
VKGNAYRILVGEPDGGECLKNQGVNGNIILKCVFNKYKGEALQT